MTGSQPDTQDTATRPISVAELLARHGSIGSPPPGGRRRRRRGNSDAVTVAELTGEIPIIRADIPERDPVAAPQPAAEPQPVASEPEAQPEAEPQPVASQPEAQPVAPEHSVEPAGNGSTIGWAEPGPRWPRSMPERGSGPEHSPYPRPARRSEPVDDERGAAEQMSPDPDPYAGISMAVAAAHQEATATVEQTTEDGDLTDRARSGLRASRLFGKRRRADGEDSTSADLDEENLAGLAALEALEPARPAELDDDHADIEEDLAGEPVPELSRWSELLSGSAIVLQSMLAVAFGAGLFIAFDQLWRWNDIVALVLTVLVTLGLVAAVQAVRKTVDIGSTLTAVAVGLLVTLGPLALHMN